MTTSPSHRGVITINGNEFVTVGPMTWEADPGFPIINVPTGQRQLTDLTTPQTVLLKGPLAMGQRFGNSTNHCFDQENVVAWWPGSITRGPQRISTTFSGPTTFKVQPGIGFAEGLNKVFMFGDAASTGQEPVWYWVGGTTTWTDATLNADAGADVWKISGMAEIGGVLYAMADQVKTNGSYNRLTYSSSNGTTWAEVVTASAHETLPAQSGTTLTRMSFLLDATGLRDSVSVVGPLIALGWVDGGNEIRPIDRPTTAATTAWSSLSLDAVYDAGEPRGFVIYPGPDGVADLFVTTKIGCYYYNLSTSGVQPTRLIKWRNRSSSYSGTMALGGDGRLYMADGPNLLRFEWLSSAGSYKVDYVGPEFYVGFASPEQRGDVFPWGGVVTKRLGDITAIFPDPIQDCLWVAKGGLAASRNATIWRYDLKTGEWYSPYTNGTAQRAIHGIFVSVEDDSTERLHFTEEQAAGGDQEPFFFEKLSIHPVVDSAWKYAASGTITDSERDMGFPRVKGFLAIEAYGNDFTSTFKLTVKDGQDGATPANSQNITASGGIVWPDKTDGSAGVGVAGRSQQLEIGLEGTAGANVGPTLLGLSETWNIVPLKSDGTLPKIFTVTISRDKNEYVRLNTTPANVVSRLETAYELQGLVAISYDDAGTTKTANVKLMPFAVGERPQNAAERGRETDMSPIRLQMREVY